METRGNVRLAIIGGALFLAALAGPAAAQVPLTPVIGISPQSFDFGSCTTIGTCRARAFDVYNAVNDPSSILEITSVIVNGVAFTIDSGPTPPISIPGDGSFVTFVVRFCPTDGIPQSGSFVVTAPNAPNSPLEAPLSGTGNFAPYCAAGGPYTGVEGVPIMFNGLGSGDPGGGMIMSFAWTFGDGATGFGPTPTHTYATAGNYTATLTVTDNCGETSTCEAAVAIFGGTNQPPICDAGGPYAAPPDVPIQFDGTGSSDPDGTIVLYAWNFGDGATGSGPTPTHAYAANGVYTVVLCVTDDDQASECCTTTADVGATPVEPSTWGAIKSRYND